MITGDRWWDMRGTWQGRVLTAARGRMQLAVPSILAHTEADITMLNLMTSCLPRCWNPSRMSLRTPFICSIAKVDKKGRIVADVIEREVKIGPMRRRNAVLFADVADFRTEMCRLAEVCRLSDDDMVQFFSAAVKWLAADMRLDPTMDRNDPDAKRMTGPDTKPAYPVIVH